MAGKIPKNIDEYIAPFPEPIQEILQKVRATIENAAPEAEEAMSYGMPAFKQNGILVFFAAWKSHIGFYPTGTGMETVKHLLTDYKQSKGAVQFPFDKPIPYNLIEKIVKLRVKQNMSAIE